MRYLTSAFIGEGTFDRHFLPPLLTRALNAICDEVFEESVSVPDVVPLARHARPHTIPQILQLVDDNLGCFDIVFVHRDQDHRDSRQVMKQWFTPLRSRWAPRSEQLVPVIPVRVTDAWTLADGAALRQVLGVSSSNRDLGIPPQPAGVETMSDAKAVASALFGSGSSSGSMLVRMGELVRIDALRAVPAFAEWWAQTSVVLDSCGFKRR